MKKLGLSFVLLFLITSMLQFLTYGQETESLITVYPVYPDNQSLDHRGYYHLDVEGGQEQTVYIDIENHTDDEVIVEVYPVDSFTAPTGGILYSEEMDEEESRILSPDLAISNFITTEREITIPPNTVESVPFTIFVPDVESGQFIGAIRVVASVPDEDEEVDENTDNANVVIKNRISFTTAVQLDLPQEAESDFSFGETNVRTRPANRELLIEMINNAQIILRGTTGKYRVVYEEEELFSGEIQEFTMVPNTAIYFPVPWETEHIDPGEYTVFLTANVLGEELEEVRTFTIETEKSREHEELIVGEITEASAPSIPVWLWIIGGVGIVVLLGFGYWLGARGK